MPKSQTPSAIGAIIKSQYLFDWRFRVMVPLSVELTPGARLGLDSVVQKFGWNLPHNCGARKRGGMRDVMKQDGVNKMVPPSPATLVLVYLSQTGNVSRGFEFTTALDTDLVLKG
ncbi:hypothetical protein EVAR_92586_1 [Eumeta japonica]|uniref:Uncharacterized protein n=1 Tax=Eumeta variegata TaxID=151549 RepID=A0A4C1SZA4_EUMVA|nr:hypothetical protein EVAR_92586_1 [Eumeta japonica]